MDDEEVLAYFRAKRKDPYLTLSTARALQALEAKFGYLHRKDDGPSQQSEPPAG
jgi:hypothetical protein